MICLCRNRGIGLGGREGISPGFCYYMYGESDTTAQGDGRGREWERESEERGVRVIVSAVVST